MAIAVSYPRRILLASCLVLGVFAAWYLELLDESSTLPASLRSRNSNNNNDNIRHDLDAYGISPLTPMTTVIGSTELYYMVPTPRKKVKGILLFFHGCNHGGQDFFRLPEERRVAYAALGRRLAVVSVSSQNQVSGCWSKSADLQELPQVIDIWRQSVARLSPKLPRMAMGISSGGGFLFNAYDSLKLKSMCNYVMWKSFTDLSHPSTLPATAFVYMPRDTKAAGIVPKLHDALIQVGVPTKLFEVHPHPLTPRVCENRIPELEEGASCEEILNQVRLHNTDLLDEQYNVLEPYKGGKWESVFVEANLDAPEEGEDYFEKEGKEREKTKKKKKRKKKKKKKKKKKRDDKDHELLADQGFDGHSWLWASLNEEIAVSYAKHEMTSEHVHDVLDFLMKHAGIIDTEH